MIWQLDLSIIPNDTPVLFFLSEELAGSRVHAGMRIKVANGYLMTVGAIFAYDAPDILAWRSMVSLPGKGS